MLGKKILSIVSVLLLGSLTTVKALVLPPCSFDDTYNAGNCVSAGDHNSYCLDGLNVYSVTSANECRVGTNLNPSTVNVLDTSSGVNIVNLAEANADISTSVNTIALVDCDTSTCKQTYGYVADSAYFYKVSYSGGSSDVTVNEEVNSATDCSSDIGGLIKYDEKVYLCIDNDKSVELKADGAGDNYLMNNAASNIFSGASSVTYPKLVVKQGINAITFNNLYTDEEYCVYESNLIMNRIKQFCVGNILDNLYNCSEGKCQLSGSPIVAGSYIVEGSDSSLGLYTCTEAGTSTVNCLKDDGTFDGINVVSDTVNEEGYTFLKKVVKEGLEGITNEEKLSGAKLQLYDCKDGVCIRTSGFIQYDGTLSQRALCASNAECTPATTTDLTVEGVAIIDSDLKVYDSGDITKDTVLFPIDTAGKEYFYKKDDDKIVLIRTVSDEETDASVMVVGIAKYYGEEIIAGDDHIVVSECQSINQNTYTLSGATVTGVTECRIPCNLGSAENCKEGFYLKVDSSLANTRTATGTLYECNLVEDIMRCGIAQSVGTGLYRNADEITSGHPDYIKCTGTSSCEGVEATVVASDGLCGDAGIGGIIKYGNNEKLCLTGQATGAKTVSLYATGDGVTTDIGNQFFISIDSANAFGEVSGKYVLIDVSKNKVLKNESEIKYRYTNADYKVRYRNDQNDVCDAGAVTHTIYEYIIEDTTRHVYKEGKSQVV